MPNAGRSAASPWKNDRPPQFSSPVIPRVSIASPACWKTFVSSARIVSFALASAATVAWRSAFAQPASAALPLRLLW